MKKNVFAVAIIIILATAGIWKYYHSKYALYARFGHWTMKNNVSSGGLQWVDFEWEGDSIGNRWVKYAAIFVPVEIDDIPIKFRCQLDDGANVSMLYDNPLQALIQKYPALKATYKTGVYGRDTIPYLSGLKLHTGGITFASQCVAVQKGFGDDINIDSLSAHPSEVVGTIGVDVCKGRVLIIDYPRKRFCITDSIPAAYHTVMSGITFDGQGRPVFDMSHKGRHYKIEFDCGSSIFPLLMLQKEIGSLSAAPGIDTVGIWSWGIKNNMIGRPMNDSFELAGRRFKNVEIYTSEKANNENVPHGCDGLTGNILFLDKVLIIDFKNKKAGLL